MKHFGPIGGQKSYKDTYMWRLCLSRIAPKIGISGGWRAQPGAEVAFDAHSDIRDFNFPGLGMLQNLPEQDIWQTPRAVIRPRYRPRPQTGRDSSSVHRPSRDLGSSSNLRARKFTKSYGLPSRKFSPDRAACGRERQSPRCRVLRANRLGERSGVRKSHALL